MSEQTDKKLSVSEYAKILLAKDSPALMSCLNTYINIQMDIKYLQELQKRLNHKIICTCLEQQIGFEAFSVNHRKLRQIVDKKRK